MRKIDERETIIHEFSRGEEHKAQVKEEAVEGAQSLRVPQEVVVCMGGEAGEAEDPMVETFQKQGHLQRARMEEGIQV